MPDELSPAMLSQLSEFVSGRMGLHFPKERWRDLEKGIRSAARGSGAGSAGEYAARLLSDPLEKGQIEILASELTVGETYFFRDNRCFDILGGQLLPDLVRARQDGERRLRVWSAGCCTGEEAYSIAILLDRVLPARREWHITILATDINPRFLQKAAGGIYGEWSFRDPPAWLKGGYFHPVAGRRYEILPRIKEMVTFANLNLAEDTYPSLSNNTNAMDLILCRNVLMYFSPDRVRQVARNFHRSLVDGGRLIVSPTETSTQLFHEFVPLNFEGAVFYGKGDRRPPPGLVIPFFTEPSARHAEPLVPAPVIPMAPEVPGVMQVQTAEKPPAAATIYREAMTLFEQGDYIGAAGKLDAEAGLSAQGAALMARICANLGQLAKARVWAGKAIAANKLDAGLHYLHAVILQEQDALEEAASSFKRALYLDPGFILAHYALGNLSLRQHRAGETARHFTNALTLLERHAPDDLLPQSDGLAAGRLREMVQSTMSMEASL